MSQNYTGRLTLIVVVLLVGLFGIPWITDGIFSVHPLTKDKPLIEVNLKPGIDINGGTSLLYEVKPPPAGYKGNGTLAEDVAKILKTRVDPTGTRNLVWRPQGDTRLEIQIPRSSMTQENSAKVTEDYGRLKSQLAEPNISTAQVIGVVEDQTGDTRALSLKKLEHGSVQRQALFAQLTALFDQLKGKEAELTAAKVAKKPEKEIDQLALSRAEIKTDYDAAKGRIEQNNMSIDEFEQLVKATGPDRNKDLAAFKARFPERTALLNQFEQMYPKYAAATASIGDAADLKRQLRGSGVLEFHILVDNPQSDQPEMIRRLEPGGDGPAQQARDQSRWFEVDNQKEFHGRSFPWREKMYVLAWITPEKSMTHTGAGRDWGLESAKFTTDQQSVKPIVEFQFDGVGGNLFGELTGNNIHRALATILDGRIITAPNIESQIHTRGQITLSSENAQTEGLYIARTLTAGSLPAQLADEPISERVVGPQLGEENLRAGMFGCIAGLCVVAVFMIFYYHLTGLVAVLSLIFNLVVIIGILAMMNATFTLPGIAGLVLTIGVSVDANVLVFERLREEEMRGLSLKLAVRNAYDRAFTAILDSNVTTAITSVFLIYFGSEEVRGFGLTLLIGILSSMFAALYVSRTFIEVLIGKFGVKKLGSLPLSFPKWNKIMHPKIDWMGKIKYFLVFSVIFISLGLFAIIQQSMQGKVFDVEFTSGTEVQFKTKRPMADSEVRERIAKMATEIPQPSIVANGNETEKGKHSEFSVVTANADRRQVNDAVLKSMGDVLTVEVRSEFAHFNAKPEDARKAGAIQPIVLTKNRFVLKGNEVADAPQNAGGVAIVLENIQPPLTTEQITARISRELIDPAVAQLIPHVQVDRIDGKTDQQAPTSEAVVLISNNKFDYSKSETDWMDKLAAPAWKLVNEGLSREGGLQKVNNFDAQVAGDTQQAAIFATLGSIVAIMAWIWLRFGDHKYGTATVLAMIHDTIMVIGAIGLSHWFADTFIGHILGLEAFRVNMTLVAAILTVMGYSMVDTIVVFDRIRENRGKYGTISRSLINDSVNQTLSRTLLTAGTTLMTLFVMYVWGGPAIHGFTFLLLVGILIGTYSSIAIAAPILLIGVKPVSGPKSSGKNATSGAISQPEPVQRIGA